MYCAVLCCTVLYCNVLYYILYCIVQGLVSDSSQRPATTCLVMLVAAVPTMYSYQK